MTGGRFEERYSYGHGRRHPAAAGLSSSLVSYWKLDEATGAARADSVGGNTLTPSGTVSQATGLIGSAAGIANVSPANLACAVPVGLPTGALTVSCWVYENDVEASTVVLLRHGVAANGLAWQLSTDAAGRVLLDVSVDGVTYVTTATGDVLAPGVFCHVVGWHDPVADEIGVVVNDGAPVTVAHATGLYGAATTIQIGGVAAGTAWRMDELGIWSRVLTAGERTQLYNGGAGLAFESF